MSFQAFLSEHCGELVAASEAHLAGIILTRNGTDGLDEELMVGGMKAQRCHKKKVIVEATLFLCVMSRYKVLHLPCKRIMES